MDFNLLQGICYSTTYAGGPPEVFSGTLSVAVTGYVHGGLYLVQIAPDYNVAAASYLNLNSLGNKQMVANGSSSSVVIPIGTNQLKNAWVLMIYDETINSNTGAFVFMFSLS